MELTPTPPIYLGLSSSLHPFPLTPWFAPFPHCVPGICSPPNPPPPPPLSNPPFPYSVSLCLGCLSLPVLFGESLLFWMKLVMNPVFHDNHFRIQGLQCSSCYQPDFGSAAAPTPYTLCDFFLFFFFTHCKTACKNCRYVGQCWPSHVHWCCCLLFDLISQMSPDLYFSWHLTIGEVVCAVFINPSLFSGYVEVPH